MSTPYSGRTVALLTRHGKEKLLAPIMEPQLGCKLVSVTGIDTDQLGTFTREIPRLGTQLDAARKKARMGMSAAALPLGLASEGAFGPDPVAGMLPWNVELLIWIDDDLGLEVLGRAQGPGCFAHRLAASWEAAVEFAHKIGFPEQQLVLRPDRDEDPRIRKGIGSWDDLSAHFRELSKLSPTGNVFIESDGRAHANPTRQVMIRRAAGDLVRRLCTNCRACGAPGFGNIEPVLGLPCADCHFPTSRAHSDRFGCVRCSHGETRRREGAAWADPQYCHNCNP